MTFSCIFHSFFSCHSVWSGMPLIPAAGILQKYSTSPCPVPHPTIVSPGRLSVPPSASLWGCFHSCSLASQRTGTPFPPLSRMFRTFLLNPSCFRPIIFSVSCLRRNGPETESLSEAFRNPGREGKGRLCRFSFPNMINAAAGRGKGEI